MVAVGESDSPNFSSLEPAYCFSGAAQSSLTLKAPLCDSFSIVTSFSVALCITGIISLRIEQLPVQQFHRQHLMDRGSVVAVSLEMAGNHSLQSLRLQIGPRERLRIQQHVPHISGQRVAVPDAIMQKFVPA